MAKIIQFPNMTKPLKITNSERIHICNVCGKEEIWGSGWEWKYVFHKGYGNSEPGWEETFKTCSEKCRKKERS